MNAYLNYIIEANIALALFLGCYHFILKDETRFRLLRIFLITGIAASLVFPLIDISSDITTTPLSIGRVIPSYWLPEVVVGNEAVAYAQENSPGFWDYATIIYLAGLAVGLLYTFFQLAQLFGMMRETTTYRLHNLHIAESNEDKPIYSFFNFIFIGNAHLLSPDEKEQIINHESVHARQWHSFDILLTNALKIVFWFNPLITQYKKNFIQLHEFEADARAVENSDVNKYCSLLARVALQSADYSLANHFNNSLTVKRIEMMRTIKANVKQWKLAALALVLPLVFFFVACQDQVGEDIMEITKNSSHALIVPAEIRHRYEQLKKENPDKNYALLELNETASQKLQDLETQYGLPKHIEVFNTTPGETETPHPGLNDLELLSTTVESKYSEVTLKKTESRMKGQTFAIVEFNAQASEISEAAAQEEKVFTVVQHQPEFPGGYDSLKSFISRNLRYPLEAKTNSLEGTVYVSFIVEKDGSISEVKLIRGIAESADQEAKRVVEMFPNWEPGRHNDQTVRVRFVLPVKFKL